MNNDNRLDPPKHTGGRPTVADPRNKIVAARLNEEEFDAVQKKLETARLTTNEAIRLLLLHENLPRKIYGGVDLSASAAYVELQPLQSNINQIAAWLNRTRPDTLSADSIQYIHQRMETCEKLLRRIRQFILTHGMRR